jgi:hypothetical protein
MMRSMWRGTVLAVAAVVVVGVMAVAAQAAPPNYHYNRVAYNRGPVVMPNFSSLPNPNFYVAPGLRINQAAYNIRVLGNAYASVPPYVYGYNPYPQVANYGPVYPYNTFNYAPTYPIVRPYPVYPYNLYGPGFSYYGY